MSYVCKKVGDSWELQKKDGGKVLGSHDSNASCMKQMRAIYLEEMTRPENIRFDGYISMPWDLSYKIDNAGDYINVVINSEGGSLFDAIMIHNRLRNAGKPINVYIEAFALSAGAILMLAGDKVYMAENGLIFFHPPKVSSYEQKGAEDLADIIEVLRKGEESLVNTLVSKTKKSKEECQAIISNDTWFTPQEALEFGIVDEIIPIIRDTPEIKNYFPERIVNFVREKSNMPLKEICAKFGVSATEADAEEKLVNYIQSLQPKPQPAPSNISDGIVNMVKRSREIELDALVSDGRQVPAVVNALKTKFCTPERIKADCIQENQEFDNVVNALKLNDQVVSFKSKSGTQTLPKDDAAEDALAKRMEKLAR